MNAKIISLLLSFFLFLTIQAQEIEVLKQKLSQRLTELLAMKKSDYLNAPTNSKIYNDYFQNYHYKYIFDNMREDQINEIKNRYGFSERVANEIQSAKENFISGIIDDSGMDFSQKPNEKYVVFKLSFGTALKENDIIYFMFLEISFHGDLSYNCLTRKENVCLYTFQHVKQKQCESKQVTSTLNFMPNQIKLIIDEAYYKIFNTLMEKAPFLADQSIQLFVSHGNAIFTDNGEYAAYIGEFGDIAIGPTKYLDSIQPLKFFDIYCDNKYSHKEIDGEPPCFAYYCDINSYKYPGQMVHKFNMVVGNVNPTSTVFTHRKQMSKNNGAYSLVLYKNGELSLLKNSFREYKKNGDLKYNYKSEIIWTSNTKNQGVAPYRIKLSQDFRLQLLDSNNKIIYQTKEYINIPTIRYKIKDCDDLHCMHDESYNGYELSHCHDFGNAFSYFQMGVDDKSYPSLELDYYILDGKKRWIKNKKPFSYIIGSAGYENSARAFKMELTGPGSEKFKVCYYSRNYKSVNGRTQHTSSPIVCDGVSTYVVDRENHEFTENLVAFITLKTDSNPQ